MIRQAHSYLAGAASSAALICAGVVGFVLIAWLNPLRDLPLPDLGGADALAPVSSGPLPREVSSTGFGSDARATSERGQRPSGPVGEPGTGRQPSADGSTGPRAGQDLGGGGGSSLGEAPAPAPAPAPADGSRDPAPAAGSSEGGDSGLSVGGSTVNSGSVTDAVGGAVSGADQALGGALQQSGVGDVVQGAVQGAAGPESAAGQTVDGVLGTANGLIGGGGPS
jgi:hypothetical protein